MNSVKTLRLLADNSAPLHLTTEKTGPYEQTVHVQGRGTFTVNTHLDIPHFTQNLISDLQHYPNDVTINGDPVSTKPFPDLSAILVTSYENHTTEYPRTNVLTLEEGHFHTHRQNALIAGVLHCIGKPAKSMTYLTPADNPFPHWQPVHRVTLNPLSVITKEDFASLTDTEFTLLMDRNDVLPFTATLAQRDEDQTNRTIQHPKAPRRYEGPVHHYAISLPDGANNSQPFHTGEPIIAHRTPVGISPEGLSNPEFISIAEALYTADQDMVPVAQGDAPTHTVTDLTLVIDAPNVQRKSCLQPTKSITLSLGLDKQPPDREVTPRLWMTFDDLLSGIDTVSYIPGTLDVPYMTECLIRAYWTDDDSISRSGDGDDMARLAFNMACLAESALSDPVAAYTEQLQQHLDDFQSELPAPEREITVTSPYRNISMTYRPSPGPA